jgi:glycosyltransferase involved in cell wall biosynthesis
VTPLRFLFVTADEFPTFRPDVEILFGKEFLRRGHQIDWIASGPSATHGIVETSWRGCRAWLAPSGGGTGLLGRLRRHAVALRNESRILILARRERYDFLQVKDCYLAAVVGLLAARLTATPFYYWHSFPFPEASLAQAESVGAQYPVLQRQVYRLLYRLRAAALHLLLYRIICPGADHVFVQSDEMRRQMARKGVSPDKMTPVPMGVDDALVALADRAAPPRATAPRIVYLGALDRLRRLDFLVRVHALVVRRFPQAQLHFVGDSHDPADIEFLKAEARDQRVEGSVHFTGFLPRERALDEVAAAAVCVSPLPPGPVFAVSSPTKVLEYLALGRPVVANHVPDTGKVLTESGGGLSVPYAEEPFADAICTLLRDAARADEMGRQGRDYVRTHRTYSVLADALETRYAELHGRYAAATASGNERHDEPDCPAPRAGAGTTETKGAGARFEP